LSVTLKSGGGRRMQRDETGFAVFALTNDQHTVLKQYVHALKSQRFRNSHAGSGN